MSIDMSDVEQLLSQNVRDNSVLEEMEQKMQTLRANIKCRERRLFRICKHKYVVDVNRTTSEDCKYYCEICGCWQDRYMYE